MERMIHQAHELTIVCPNCSSSFALDRTLAEPFVEQARRDLAKKEDALRAREAEVASRKAALEDELRERLTAQRSAIAREEAARAREALALELSQRDSRVRDLEEALASSREKQATAAAAEAEFRRMRRELEDRVREADAIVQRRVDEAMGQAREAARQAAEESARLKVLEKDKVIEDMRRQLAEAQRKADQGSQQLQGEVQELDLESKLRARFPRDVIEPVPKGTHGGDALQRVQTPHGAHAGSILWEAKRTQHFSPAWLAKLRDDQRAAGAEIAVLVTHALPRELSTFDCMDGVWVTGPGCAIPVALALRQALIDVACARQTSENQHSKMEHVYRYLTGPRFAHRLQAIVEKFTDMHADLDKERKAMQRLWAKRQTQIEAVIEATAGMYGDLQGIATGALPEIPGLDQKLLEFPE